MKSYKIFTAGHGSYVIQAEEMVVHLSEKLVIFYRKGDIVGSASLEQVTCVLEQS